MKLTIGILDPSHPALAEKLARAGHEVLDRSLMDAHQWADALPRMQALVVRSSRVDATMLGSMPALRLVGRVGSGLENIDTARCRALGIHVANSPEGNRDGVGEACVMLLLALMKALVRANAQVKAGIWAREANRGTELRGKRVGIIGYGHMGSAFADKLRGFGVSVLAHDKYRSGFDRAGVLECSLEHLMRESDVISLHLPLNASTRHYADRAFFESLAKPVWFINTSRGGVVHTSALLDALDEGRVIAAGLDVLEHERPDLAGLEHTYQPETLRRLLTHERVIITPHVAGVTHEGARRMAEVLADKLIAAATHKLR